MLRGSDSPASQIAVMVTGCSAVSSTGAMTAKTTSSASFGVSKRSVSVLLLPVSVGAASGSAASTVMRPVTGCGNASVISETFSPRSFFGMRIFST